MASKYSRGSESLSPVPKERLPRLDAKRPGLGDADSWGIWLPLLAIYPAQYRGKKDAEKSHQDAVDNQPDSPLAEERIVGEDRTASTCRQYG